ncbi:MAG: response regulator [Verrucomicrobia bacterium]|nr:response regulator [Verrucomicrobiota bacterium]
MISPPIPPNETERLAALRRLAIVGSSKEERFDRITRLAAQIFGAPIALISLVEETEQWFKSQVGLSVRSTPREVSFCAHALNSPNSLVVPDAEADPRFCQNPLVTDDPFVRFYAGHPLTTSEGHRLGTLCILDRKPRRLDAHQLATLRDLASMAQDELLNTDLNATISRLMQREEALHETERQYRDIFENVACGIYQTSRDGAYRNVNPALARIHGFDSPEELLTMAFDLGQQLYARPAQREELMQLLDEHEDVNGFECEMLRKDGSTIWVCQNVRRVTDGEGKLLYYMGSVEDITSRRYASVAQAQAADAAIENAKLKSEFLSTMSHEIRTPMHGIIGMANLLLNTQLSGEQEELARLIGTCGDNLLALVNNILDFSKIESGGMEIHLAPFALEDCTRGSLGPLAVVANEKDVKLSCEIDSRIPPVLISDAAWLRQIFNNLVSNGLKFTPAGGSIDITITGDPLDPADLPEHVAAALVPYPDAVPWMFHFTVRDTGVGIPEEKLHRLFKPFSQADAATSRKYGGTGLGLAICHRLCEMMGGSIWLESEVGLGTSFEFTVKSAALPEGATLPVPAALPAVAAAAAAISAGSATAGGVNGHEAPAAPALTILLVEDNRVNQRVAMGLLRQHGYTADLAENGIEALRACEKRDYDVILMDVQMPEMDGLEATRQLRARQAPNEVGPYIIAMTANALAGDRELCLNAGMDEYVTKPVTGKQLQATLLQAAQTRTLVAAINNFPPMETDCCESATALADSSAEAGYPEFDRVASTPPPMVPVPALPKTVQVATPPLIPARLDPDSLTALKGLQAEGDEGFLRELIELFLADAAQRIDGMDTALAAGRDADFVRAAHSIKGAAANFGATDLRKICARIEDLGREGQVSEAGALLPELRAEFSRVRLALEAEAGA